MTIKEISDKLLDGKYNEVDKTDMVAYAKAMQEAAEGKINKGDPKWQGIDINDANGVWTKLAPALEEMRNSPQGQEHLKATLINNRSQRFTAQYGPFFKSILAGADIATSVQQINAAQRGLNRLVRPSIPPPPGVDPRLEYALRQSEQATGAAPQAANVAKADIFDQYQQDIRNATTAGGGQQAAFGALAQTASERRNRGLARLLPLTNQIQMEREEMRNHLLTERGRQNQYNYQNRLEAAGMEFNQYNQEAKVAGALGAQGRLNLRQTLGGISDLAPQLAARMYPVSNPYINQDQQRSPRSTQPGVFLQSAAEMDDNVTNSLARHIAMQHRNNYEALGDEPNYNDQIRY